jgi:cell division protein FtsI/penicillin-binding protein 2
MKLNEQSQNLGVRIGTIHIIAFILLAILGVRLYYLQVVKGEHYAERAEISASVTFRFPHLAGRYWTATERSLSTPVRRGM